MLAQLLDRDTVTIQRVGTTQASDGSRVEAYSTANRGALPTSWKCRIQQMTVNERIAYGLKGNQVGWKLMGSVRPQITQQDRITFTDSEGTSHTVEIIGGERNMDNQGIAWQVDGTTVSSES